MKKRTKRSIVILTLGALGTLALAMRPALCPDTAINTSEPEGMSLPLANAAEKENPMDIRFPLDISRPEGYTSYLHEKGTDAFALLEPAVWNIRFYTEDGKFCIEGDAPLLHAKDALSQVKANFQTIVFGIGAEKMPNNSRHRIYTVYVLCQVVVTPSFWGEQVRSAFLQSYRVDVESGCIEPQIPRLPFMVPGEKVEPVLTTRLPISALPARYAGTKEEMALVGMLHAIGKIDNKFFARRAAQTLPQTAKQELDQLTLPDKPWPDCWGDAAGTARECAKRITPSLVYLQEKECFGCQELVDFINSPAFARYFGESFADKVPDPLDEPIGDYTIEKVSPEQIPDDEDTQEPAESAQ